MSVFYTVSRRGIIKERLLNFIHMSDVFRQLNMKNDVMLDFLEESFPRGISRHGMYYICEVCRKEHKINMTIETVFEFVRKSYYPNIQSRFESLFAWETIEMARSFKNNNQFPIYKVKSDKYFKADLNFLKSGMNFFDFVNNAKKYWSGTPSANPQWECLLQYPVEILEKVE